MNYKNDLHKITRLIRDHLSVLSHKNPDVQIGGKFNFYRFLYVMSHWEGVGQIVSP